MLQWQQQKVFSLNGRSALPGQGHQNLHVDWAAAVAPGDYQITNSIWMLDDFTPENGATRVVPGSHRWGRLPKDALADPGAPHPDEVLVVGKAGTCVVFNSHLWHGGTLNQTAKPRRAIHAAFVRRDQRQQTVFPTTCTTRPTSASPPPSATSSRSDQAISPDNWALRCYRHPRAICHSDLGKAVTPEASGEAQGEHWRSAGRRALPVGLSINEVSRQTRIREAVIWGIELDNYALCGGDFYARGHIRAIAQVVGIDSVPLIQEFDARRQEQEARRQAEADNLRTSMLLAPRPSNATSAARPANSASSCKSADLPVGLRDQAARPGPAPASPTYRRRQRRRVVLSTALCLVVLAIFGVEAYHFGQDMRPSSENTAQAAFNRSSAPSTPNQPRPSPAGRNRPRRQPTPPRLPSKP